MLLFVLSLLACDFDEKPDAPAPAKVEQDRVVVREYTPQEMEVLCSGLTRSARDQLIGAQSRVENLEETLRLREAELAELKARVENDEAKKAAAARRWKEIEAEIATLRQDRDDAVRERDALREELKTTLLELDRQIARANAFKAKAKEFKKKSTENDWQAFLANAKLEICDKGSRKRHEKCHEAVEQALGPAIMAKFEVCVDSYQARPTLRAMEKGEALPEYGQRLPDDNKFTRSGWAILFCDPTLPEGKVMSDIDKELMEP